VNKNEIIRILEDWNLWKKELETGVPRETYLQELDKFLKSNQVVVITGPRRSGKSYIMRQLAKSLLKKQVAKNNILIINFEDPRFPELNAKKLADIFEIYLGYMRPTGDIYVFLDEVQEVKGWEKWVCSMHELKKARVIVSGSNANLLSKELATVLTGRHLDLMILPLSFKEYLLFHNIELKDELDMIRQETAIKGLLLKYLEEGSYPEVVLSEKGREILLTYFDDILNKDLIRRFKIRKTEKFKSLAKYYLSQTASLSTYNSTAKFLGITADTVEKFSGYLASAYLLFFVKRFSFKVKEQEKSPRKIYVVDTGLANAAGFRFSDNWGRIAENLVFLELKRKQTLSPGLELFFWKDVHHREVDFVLKEGLRNKQLIQVSWATGQPRTKDREMRSLLKAMKEFDLSKAIVITEDEQRKEEIEGKQIAFIPLWKWLLTL
jgi:uncharacterized protein